LRKQNFLRDLYSERKIQIVNPSENVMDAYLKKSGSYLSSAKLLRDNNHYEESVSMAYYSMYYMVLALFFRCGIKCENHAATILILKDVFDIDNTALSNAKKERIDKQYYVDTVATKEDVEDLIVVAEHFNAHLLNVTARISNDKIGRYRENLKEILA
jgi:uncharacterized protein (UPF0332 family)